MVSIGIKPPKAKKVKGEKLKLFRNNFDLYLLLIPGLVYLSLIHIS